MSSVSLYCELDVFLLSLSRGGDSAPAEEETSSRRSRRKGGDDDEAPTEVTRCFQSLDKLFFLSDE